MADHILQSRPLQVPGGILLIPCPPGITGVYRVIWHGQIIYEKKPEDWKFPEATEMDRLMDEADRVRASNDHRASP